MVSMIHTLSSKCKISSSSLLLCNKIHNRHLYVSEYTIKIKSLYFKSKKINTKNVDFVIIIQIDNYYLKLIKHKNQ